MYLEGGLMGDQYSQQQYQKWQQQNQQEANASTSTNYFQQNPQMNQYAQQRAQLYQQQMVQQQQYQPNMYYPTGYNQQLPQQYSVANPFDIRNFQQQQQMNYPQNYRLQYPGTMQQQQQEQKPKDGPADVVRIHRTSNQYQQLNTQGTRQIPIKQEIPPSVSTPTSTNMQYASQTAGQPQMFQKSIQIKQEPLGQDIHPTTSNYSMLQKKADDIMEIDIKPAEFQIQKLENYMPPPQLNENVSGFDEYMRGRKLTPTAFMGAEAIEPANGFYEPLPNKDFNSQKIELLDKIDSKESKDSFRQKIKKALMCSQYIPTEEEKNESFMPIPEAPIELSDAWCHIHYYEFSSKIGQSFRGTSSAVTIDGLCAPSDASRFCLGAVANPNRDPVAVSARRQIGKGWKLIKLDNGNIIIESHNETALFVQTPTHASEQKDHLATVYRLPGGHSMELFNHDHFMNILEQTRQKHDYAAVYSLKKFCQMRMSFVKGWGEKYRRQAITVTPCWAEIHLVQMLQLVDNVLSTLQAPDCDGNSDT